MRSELSIIIEVARDLHSMNISIFNIKRNIRFV